jgi:hypothetical protein
VVFLYIVARKEFDSGEEMVLDSFYHGWILTSGDYYKTVIFHDLCYIDCDFDLVFDLLLDRDSLL